MKKKLLIIVPLIFFLTGCNATYNVEIYNDKVRESVITIDESPDTWDEKDQYGVSYRDKIDKISNYPVPIFYDAEVNENDTIKTSGVRYYKFSKISTDKKLGYKLKYNSFGLSDYSKSSIIRSCYKFFKVLDSDDKIYLSTSLENTCFSNYGLENLTINIKTNHVVVDSNADIEDGVNYTWNISIEDSKNSPIMLVLEKNKYVFNYDNIIGKVALFSLIVTILIVVLKKVGIISIKSYINKKNNI